MIFSSSFSQPSLLIPNQHNKSPSPSPPPSPLQSYRPLSTKAKAKTASSSLPSSLYEVLKIPMGATVDEIKVAYRKLARVFHPDVAAKDTPVDEFMKIHSAYSTLSDPEKRADYDQRISLSGMRFSTIRATPSGTPVPVYSRRKWETDQCW